MKRREFLVGLAGAASQSQLNRAAGSQTGAPEKTNVVLILSDDQGYGDLSSHGNPYLKTPNIERLGREGVEFTRFYVNPVCAPTRSALLTGRYNVRCGVHGVTFGWETMRTEETTIAEALRGAGYKTALFGKWHLGSHYPYVPHAQGFDEFIGFRTGHWMNYYDPKFERNGKPHPLKGYVTEALTSEAIRFIEENRAAPFFVYLAYNVPHTPYQVPEHYVDAFRGLDLPESTKASYAMTKCMDDNVGRLLNRLDELKLAGNTVVIFLSDNGPNSDRFNSGLRGKKASVYEGGNRVPFFLRLKGRVPAAKKVDRIAAHIDVFPTLMELCGVTPPKGPAVDGKSLVPLLKGDGAGWHDRMLFTHRERQTDPGSVYPGCVRTQRFNLVGEDELYDMAADPGETTNVAAKYPEVAKKLRAAYEAWYRDALPPGGFRAYPIPVGYDEENPAWLPAPEGELRGGLKYRGGSGYAHDWAANWKTLEDAVDWDIDVVRAGRYELSLEYLCPPDSVGSKVEIRVGSAAATAMIEQPTLMEKIPARDVVARSETGEMHWKTVSAGVVVLPKGRAKVTVKAVSKPGAVVMELNRVIVRRVE